ncbi:GNAT family N-acetyltransferase [Candidatus Synechococcus calcipolaris]|uniref:GNAT family N-acetyltransferase n=1 Tax=Candidatus Synechococcus calcipolaris TaxID=1522304 RepID=UPI003BAA456B
MRQSWGYTHLQFHLTLINSPPRISFIYLVFVPSCQLKVFVPFEATGHGAWGEVAYLLGEAWWGKGLAFEAMSWWHDYLATVTPRTEWWATVHPMNQRSIRLLKRLGYREVAPNQCPKLYSYDLGDCCFVKSLPSF